MTQILRNDSLLHWNTQCGNCASYHDFDCGLKSVDESTAAVAPHTSVIQDLNWMRVTCCLDWITWLCCSLVKRMSCIVEGPCSILSFHSAFSQFKSLRFPFPHHCICQFDFHVTNFRKNSHHGTLSFHTEMMEWNDAIIKQYSCFYCVCSAFVLICWSILFNFNTIGTKTNLEITN